MPNLTPLVVGLVEVGAGVLVPPFSPFVGKFVEVLISDEQEVQREIGHIHSRINYLEQRVNKLESRMTDIERTINQQILRPFNVAHEFLERAKSTSSKKEYRRFIGEAQFRFFEASTVNIGKDINPVIPIRALFYGGVCYDLLEKSTNAKTEYEKAHKKVSQLIRSQDLVYSHWQIFKKEELNRLKEELSRVAKQIALNRVAKQIALIEGEDSRRYSTPLAKQIGLTKGGDSRRHIRPRRNITGPIKLSPRMKGSRRTIGPADQEKLFESLKNRRSALQRYPDTLDNLINPEVNDHQTKLARNNFPAPLINEATYYGWDNPVSALTLTTLNSQRLDYRESLDAWALAIVLTTIVASRRLNEPAK